MSLSLSRPGTAELNMTDDFTEAPESGSSSPECSASLAEAQSVRTWHKSLSVLFLVMAVIKTERRLQLCFQMTYNLICNKDVCVCARKLRKMLLTNAVTELIASKALMVLGCSVKTVRRIDGNRNISNRKLFLS